MTAHEHGTDLCYTTNHCRRDECRQAHNKAARDRRRQQAYGRYNRNKRPATKTLNHINTLRAQGITLKQIHRNTGVAMITLGEITLGKRNTIQATTENRILKYNPGPEHASPHASIDSTGTARRLQALQYNGWSQNQLAQHLGVQVAHVWKLSHQKTGATILIAKRVNTLYDELWDKHPAPGMSATIARNTARRNGWLPPLAWDEDHIDNPNHHGYAKDIAA
jgi:transcriptional regulator with XRE-family HTH domain